VRVGFEEVMKNSAFWNIISYSSLKVKRRFGETRRLDLEGRRISQASNKCEAGSNNYSTLKMEATNSSETSIEFQRNTRCDIPEDITLQNLYVIMFLAEKC
jgi:hypothetical protein